MVTDRLDLLRLAVVAILYVVSRPGSPTISRLARGNAISDPFTVAVMSLRAYTFETICP